MKLGDIETRVAHEAVPSKRDAELLMHLTADLKQDTRFAGRACWPARARVVICAVQNTGH